MRSQSSKVVERLFGSGIEDFIFAKGFKPRRFIGRGGGFHFFFPGVALNIQPKNICQIEQSRHRSVYNFMVNVFTALIAYTYQPKKPSPMKSSGISFGEKLPVIF